MPPSPLSHVCSFVPRWAPLLLLGAFLGTAPSAHAADAPAAPAAPGVTATSPEKVDPALAKALAFAEQVDAALVKAVAAVHQSSVTVWNLRKLPGAKPGEVAPMVRASGGSGVLVTIKGKGPFVVSNEHVVKDADALEIAMYDGSTYPVKLKDHVARYDIALLDFEKEKPKSWKAARVGKSEALVEGQWVIATGNPFFLGGDGCCVATFGVISGLDRTLRGEFTYANAIQHDAEVNPGNSGGPLWNLAGELIGINGMISSRGGGASVGASNTGASFAIPVHLIQRYYDELLSDSVAAAAGYLGVDVEDARDAGGRPIGVRVREVRGDSPVKRADAKTNPPEKGDVVTQLSMGTSVTMKAFPVYSASDFTNALALYPAGARVRIAYTRGTKKLAWTGELGGAPADGSAGKRR